jgi:PAS domain S-box-containing protein
MSHDDHHLSDRAVARWPRTLAWVALLTPLPGYLGWLLGIRALVQPLASFAPARIWGTLPILLGALALLAKLRAAPQWARALAIACGALALAGMLTGLLQRSLPIDQVASVRVGLPTHLGAMSYPVSVLFLLYSAALYLHASAQRSERRMVVVGALASTQVALGGVLFVVQLAGLLDSDTAVLVRAPVQGVFAATLLGVALLQRATVREHRTMAAPRWAPTLAGVSVGLVVVVLWQALRARDRSHVRERDAVTVAALDRAVQRQFRTVNKALARTAVYLAASAQQRDLIWTTTLPRLIEETEGLQRLVWTDSLGQVLHALPADGLDAPALRALRQFAATVGTRGANGAVSDTSSAGHVAVMEGSPWRVALWYRVPSPVAGATMLIGVVDERQLLQLFADETKPDVALRVTDGTTTVLEQGTLGAAPLAVPLRIGTRVLRVAVSQTGGSQRTSPLPNVVLVLGLAVAALLAITLWLQRRLVAQASVEGMARMQRVIERATDGVWELEVHHGRTHRSPGLLRYLGIDPVLLDGGFAAWSALIHPADTARVASTLEAHLRGQSEAFECEYRLQAGDGTWHTLVDRGRVVEREADGQPVRVLGVSADVTERIRADTARDASERRFRAMFDTAYQMQLLLDLDGRILEANRAAGALAQLSPERLQGQTFWLAPWWADDALTGERVQERFLRARNGETLRFEVEVAYGRERPITVDFSLKPIVDGEDRVTQVLAEGRDLTVRKRAEESLREISALTTMGQLAARVAHEINNPLAGIQNSFLLIRSAIPEDHPHYRFVGAIEREIGRIAAVTRQLYETYRPDQSMTRHASVIIAISDAVSFLEQVNRARDVRIVTDVARAPSVVPVPDALLRQTLYNLVQNALDVSPPKGTIFVTAYQDGDACVLSVADEGPGIPLAIRERIFDAFFSTKDRTMKTSGMGIGLALVRQSVLAVGGRIDVRDRPNGGTEFHVCLPMTPLDTGALR